MGNIVNPHGNLKLQGLHVAHVLHFSDVGHMGRRAARAGGAMMSNELAEASDWELHAH